MGEGLLSGPTAYCRPCSGPLRSDLRNGDKGGMGAGREGYRECGLRRREGRTSAKPGNPKWLQK